MWLQSEHSSPTNGPSSRRLSHTPHSDQMTDSGTDGMQTMDEPNNEGQALSTENMDGSEGVPDLTQLYLQEGPSQTSPRPSIPVHQPEPFT